MDNVGGGSAGLLLGFGATEITGRPRNVVGMDGFINQGVTAADNFTDKIGGGTPVCGICLVNKTYR